MEVADFCHFQVCCSSSPGPSSISLYLSSLYIAPPHFGAGVSEPVPRSLHFEACATDLYIATCIFRGCIYQACKPCIPKNRQKEPCWLFFYMFLERRDLQGFVSWGCMHGFMLPNTAVIEEPCWIAFFCHIRMQHRCVCSAVAT